MSRKFSADRGFLTIAQGDEYVRMAYALAMSLSATQREVSRLCVAITPGTDVPSEYEWAFDEIVEIPWNDEASTSSWKIENKWKYPHVTPYEETICLDADMLFTSDVSNWWKILAFNDVQICSRVMTYRGDMFDTREYRKCFDPNGLPDIYTGMMYVRQSDRTYEFFDVVRHVFHNWQGLFYDCLDETRPSFLSGDVAYALAIREMDAAQEFVAKNGCPRFVHMKSLGQGWDPSLMVGENWSNRVPVFFTSGLELKVGCHLQTLPFHYHDKTFLTDRIIETYEGALR